MPDTGMKKQAGYYRPRLTQKFGWIKTEPVKNVRADISGDKKDKIGDYQKLNST
jgi:hypothetical protein